MTTVAEEWNMRCPQCCGDDAIDIQMHVWGRLSAQGTDVTEPDDGSHDWDNECPARCAACNFTGTVGDFVLAQEGDASHEPDV